MIWFGNWSGVTRLTFDEDMEEVKEIVNIPISDFDRSENVRFKKVFQDKENYSIVEINEKNIPHSLIYRQKLRSIA